MKINDYIFKVHRFPTKEISVYYQHELSGQKKHIPSEVVTEFAIDGPKMATEIKTVKYSDEFFAVKVPREINIERVGLIKTKDLTDDQLIFLTIGLSLRCSI